MIELITGRSKWVFDKGRRLLSPLPHLSLPPAYLSLLVDPADHLSRAWERALALSTPVLEEQAPDVAGAPGAGAQSDPELAAASSSASSPPPSPHFMSKGFQAQPVFAAPVARQASALGKAQSGRASASGSQPETPDLLWPHSVEVRQPTVPQARSVEVPRAAEFSGGSSSLQPEGESTPEDRWTPSGMAAFGGDALEVSSLAAPDAGLALPVGRQLSRSGSRFVTREESNNGFRLAQSGTELAAVLKANVRAPQTALPSFAPVTAVPDRIEALADSPAPDLSAFGQGYPAMETILEELYERLRLEYLRMYGTLGE